MIRQCSSPYSQDYKTLTYRACGRIHHVAISETLESQPTGEEIVVYSLDHGKTKFYDLEQLVRYYQLNVGFLFGRLTHFIVSSPTPLPFGNEEEDS